MSESDAWIKARSKLDTIARKADPETKRHLDGLGLFEGWNCLEIGAGTGTLSQWLAGRVGSTGRVVATDLDTRALEGLDVPNLEVVKNNVDEEPLPAGPFDLIVARYLFEWLADPHAVLSKIVGALAPGGWLLIESSNWGALPPPWQGAPEQLQKARKAFFEFLSRSSGYNPDIGRQLPNLLEAANLRGVGATGRATLLRGGSQEVQLYKYELELAGAPIVAAGRITKADLATVLEIYDDPKFCMMSPMTITAWGRKPT
jgi:SAM-dependent methyltransferase